MGLGKYDWRKRDIQGTEKGREQEERKEGDG